MDDERFDAMMGSVCDAQDLCDIGDFEYALEICEAVELGCRNSDHPDLPELVSETLLCKGKALAGLERLGDEIQAYLEIVRRFDSIDSPVVTAQVARALFNAAVATGELGEIGESLARYSSFIDRFRTSDDLEIQEQVVRAMYNRAVTLRHSFAEEEALVGFEELIGQFGTSDDPEITDTVASAFASKAALELCLERVAAAVESATRGLAKCGDERPLERYHCSLVLAVVSMVERDIATGEQQVRSVLDVLPQIQEPSYAQRFSSMLLDMASVLGRERTLKLVEQSPSAKILSPAIQKLKQEAAHQSETVRKIQDLADELRRDFANGDQSKA